VKPPRAGSPEAALRTHALSYPDAREDFPWGERVVKVRGKVFLFLGKGESLSLSVKLPGSASVALSLPFAAPTAYGLGKSGWITARFEKGVKPPIEMLKQWIDESYRAVAPKRLAAAFDGGQAPPSNPARAKPLRARTSRASRKGRPGRVKR
jgi:predicted DNA-binding protein (MmcQ/YjbR family)